MRQIDTIPELAGLLTDADHVDVRGIESEASLREFVAAALGWRPAWLRALFRARAVLARALRLRDPDVPLGTPPGPAEISFTPGDPAAFFTVTHGAEDRYLALAATDTHLTGRLIFTTAPAGGRSRYELATVVKYHRWTGPLYFTVIRPFHHLIVAGMTRAGARTREKRPS
ncbi:DUF2867 domain-containing protein [Spirillospora sp. CA-128828]|uniref:DUF2867 domain-containing protein n=1 Tax=Spirillospora sp. CA-128828 TaxID=3240033 RepID=UPI003D89EA39